MNAIILAAGHGSRMITSKQFIHKPLLPIQGMPNIERTILMLNDFGIEEIFIIAGTYADQYMYLQKKYNCIIIADIHCSISTLYGMYYVKDKINDTFIIEGDVVLAENVFRYETYSYYYVMKYKNPEKDSWKPIIDTSGKIISFDIGYFKSPCIFGISFWSKHDAKQTVTYINNTNELPDFDFNFDKLIGKTENEIQTNIDATLKAYLDHLVKLNNTSSKPTPTVPAVRVTPTPDIGDRPITPSPTPPVTDDTSSTDKLLEQIYDWLLDFGDKHETFVELITQYIENTDGKLDQIIEAIDKLSQGSTEGEVNGCKYDYTALSEFLTQLWNESDKKFDKMVELLEENNEYQQKIVDSLNQIKALLVADTVLDVFKNRSTETANKAKEKFPTSLPWDIAMVVNAFSATPKDPVIELPIKIASMHIDEKIVVDLSSEEWAKLAKTCRYLLSILFVLYMIHLSRKFFSKGDE